MLRILLSILLLLAFLTDYSGDNRLSLLGDQPPVIVARRVDLDWRDPARRKLGGLTFLGGVHLTSPADGFGGFSAMVVVGDRFTLLSDGGNIVRFRLDRQFRLSDASFADLPDGPGTGWAKQDRDSESLTRDPATGQLWVGFEQANAIWRYSADFKRVEAKVVPRAMAQWADNSGPESMARLRDGSFVVMSEGASRVKPDARAALWFAGDPTIDSRRGFRFDYRAPDRTKPTDIAELPDGRLIILNRAVSLRAGFTAIVTVIDRSAVRRGKVVRGKDIARFEAPVVHDNFEAIAVTQEGRDTILWIASDDNEYAFQRSLLLKFRLDV